MQPVKRTAFVVAAAAALLLLSLSVSPRPSHAEGVDAWTRVRSKNFLLVGNATEREIRLVAARLEQFREVFKRLPDAGDRFDSSVPTTVVVFRDDQSYRPFAPLYQGQPNSVAGYFQASADVNYITLSTDQSHVRGSEALAVHEYVHLLVKNSFPHAPLWFNEGLAEFYSTLEVAPDKRTVKLGKPIKSRVLTLRQQGWIPLSTLFGVDDRSPFYHEPGKREMFYAQSWALVHYLLNGRGGQRRPQLLRYLDLTAAGEAHEAAFREAFQTGTATLETELQQYVQMGRYAEQTVTCAENVEFETAMQSAALTEAETKYYLGDLLLHTERAEAAEAYLLEALKLDDNLAPAHTALGMLRLRQNRFAEATKSLARAVTLDPQSYPAHFYYADALSREGMGSESPIEGYYPPEQLRLMRAELKKAIELGPDFIESYRLLALINLIMNDGLDEASAALKQAIRLAPRRLELTSLLAQVYLRQDNFQPARQLLSALLETTDSPHLRAQAQSLLETIAAREELARRLKLAAAQEELLEKPDKEVQPCDAPQPGPQKKPLRFNGEQTCGMLVRVECDERNVLLFVEAGGRNLKLRSDALSRIRFVTYTADVKGQMTCGTRQPATPVLVTYRAATDSRAQVDGEVLAVEFIPKEWNPPPAHAAP
jgi:tetratricopeptide (TPR) repeat protein